MLFRLNDLPACAGLFPARGHDDTEEQRIINGCLRQNREAQRELYRRTCDRIYRLLLRMTQDPEAAADLLRKTYVRIFRRLARGQRGSGLGAWVYRAAVNEALHHLRRLSLQRQAVGAGGLPRSGNEAGARNAPAVRLEEHEAILQLPDDERVLIILRYFEGLDYARMADVLDQPPGTIVSGLNRARRTLLGLLGGKAGSPEAVTEPGYSI